MNGRPGSRATLLHFDGRRVAFFVPVAARHAAASRLPRGCHAAATPFRRIFRPLPYEPVEEPRTAIRSLCGYLVPVVGHRQEVEK
jgi:hypothetical protein